MQKSPVPPTTSELSKEEQSNSVHMEKMHAFKLNIKVDIIVQIYRKYADVRVDRLHASFIGPEKLRWREKGKNTLSTFWENT